MTLKFEVNKVKNVLIFALLFFASMNFQAKFFYFVFGATVVLALLRRYFVIDYGILPYIGLSLWMAIYNADEGPLSMLRCLAPLCFYIVGLNMTTENDHKNKFDLEPDYIQKQGYTLLLVISLGSFSHYLMNYIYNFGNQLSRNTNDIWTGEPMAATGQNTLACLALALVTAMFFLSVKKWHRVLSVAVIGVILSYNLILAGRTLLVILVCLIITSVIYMRVNKISQQVNNLFYLLVCLIVSAIAIAFNIGGLRDRILNSQLFSRFGGSIAAMIDDGSRLETKLQFIKESLRYPMGGLHLNEKYGFAHDLLLDAYDEYGFVALILLIAILSMGVVNLYKNLRYTDYSHEFKLTLLLINVSVLLQFTVEPILAGMPWLFACYSLINGCMVGMNRSYFKKGV